MRAGGGGGKKPTETNSENVWSGKIFFSLQELTMKPLCLLIVLILALSFMDEALSHRCRPAFRACKRKCRKDHPFRPFSGNRIKRKRCKKWCKLKLYRCRRGKWHKKKDNNYYKNVSLGKKFLGHNMSVYLSFNRTEYIRKQVTWVIYMQNITVIK